MWMFFPIFNKIVCNINGCDLIGWDNGCHLIKIKWYGWKSIVLWVGFVLVWGLIQEKMKKK
ncbi:MAG: hypothetical protein F6K40_19825 [Okeania sp. SIO3I5]|nr:hypothetical protein [Okeania sp. SIO3I5]